MKILKKYYFEAKKKIKKIKVFKNIKIKNTINKYFIIYNFFYHVESNEKIVPMKITDFDRYLLCWYK